MLGTSDQEPVAAGDPKLGDSARPALRAVDPCAWLLELGAEAREVREAELRAGQHSSQRRYLSAWGSRRAGARARRRIVQQVLAFADTPLPLPVAFDDPGTVAPVADRIGAYTRS